MLVLSMIAGATAFESTPQSISYQKTGIPLFDKQEWATDWAPADSSIQMRLVLEPNFEANISAEGEGNLYWPQALEMEVQGVQDGGAIDVVGEFTVRTQVKVDAFGYVFETDVDTQEFPVSGSQTFDPFLLKSSGQENVTVDIVNKESISYKTDLTTGVTLEGSLNLDMNADVLMNNGALDMDGNKVDTAGARALLHTNGPAVEQVVSAWETQLAGHADFEYYAILDVCFSSFGCISVEPYAQVEDVGDHVSNEILGPQTTNFPLPVTDVPNDTIDFGTVTVGQTANAATTIYNDGQLDLDVSAVISNGPVDLLTPNLVVGGLSNGDINVSVTPAAAGPFEATITLDTNDPLVPTTELFVTGIAEAAEQPEEPTDTGDYGDPGDLDNTGNLQTVDGCGCASTGGSSGLLAMGLGLLGLALRRRD